MKKILYILVAFILVISIKKVNAYTEYKVGDEITYNDIKFYVIKDSSSKDSSVTMLKAEPLTVDEVNLYGGVGTANNHVNMYVTNIPTDSRYQKAVNYREYGGMVYYNSEICADYYNQDITQCKTDYSDSEVKYVVDAWALDNFSNNYIEARLITLDEVTSLGYVSDDYGQWQNTDNTPNWLYNRNYYYWTMTPLSINNPGMVIVVSKDGSLTSNLVSNGYSTQVRPVLAISKITLIDTDESIIDNDTDEQNNVDSNENNNKPDVNNESKTTVKVANTYMSSSIIIIILGFITANISVLIIYKLSSKKK